MSAQELWDSVVVNETAEHRAPGPPLPRPRDFDQLALILSVPVALMVFALVANLVLDVEWGWGAVVASSLWLIGWQLAQAWRRRGTGLR